MKAPSRILRKRELPPADREDLWLKRLARVRAEAKLAMRTQARWAQKCLARAEAAEEVVQDAALVERKRVVLLVTNHVRVVKAAAVLASPARARELAESALQLRYVLRQVRKGVR